MNIGARTFKTGIAVMLSIIVSHLLNFDTPAFAAISAFLAIQPTVYKTWKNLKEQIQANFFGATFAILGLYFFGNHPFVVGTLVMLIISFNYKLKVENIGLSVVTAIAILEIKDPNFLLFSLERFLTIMTGVFSSLLINIIFMPPKYEEKLLIHTKKTSEELSLLLKFILKGDLDNKSLRQFKITIEDNLAKANTLMSLHKEEIKNSLNRNLKYSEMKKTIILQNTVKLLEIEKELVNKLDKNKMNIFKLDYRIQTAIQELLTELTVYDEKIFMKFEGKAKLTHPDKLSEDIKMKKDILFKELIDIIQANNNQDLYLIGLMESFNELVEQLDKLNKNAINYKKGKA